MSDAPEKILEKIRKLLALAGSSNEHEAAAAAAKAQEILAEYNLDLNMVSTSRNDTTRGRVQVDFAAMYKYQQTLMAALARNNFCRHLVVNGHFTDAKGVNRFGKRHVLIGRKINVQVTSDTYSYLVERMDQLLPYTGMAKRGKDALIWLGACTEVLVERLNDRRKKQEEEVRARRASAGPSGNALVLADVYTSEEYENMDIEQGLPPGTTAARHAAAEARRAEYVQKYNEAKALYPEMDHTFWTYIAAGWSYEDSLRQMKDAEEGRARREAEANKPETEAQRRKRLEREERQAKTRYARYQRWAKDHYHPAAVEGRRAGQEIGLDQQIDQQTKKGISNV